jgi:protease II
MRQIISLVVILLMSLSAQAKNKKICGRVITVNNYNGVGKGSKHVVILETKNYEIEQINIYDYKFLYDVVDYIRDRESIPNKFPYNNTSMVSEIYHRNSPNWLDRLLGREVDTDMSGDKYIYEFKNKYFACVVVDTRHHRFLFKYTIKEALYEGSYKNRVL